PGRRTLQLEVVEQEVVRPARGRVRPHIRTELVARHTVTCRRATEEERGRRVDVVVLDHATRRNRRSRDAHRAARDVVEPAHAERDRKSTRLNSSHVKISYAVFCLKKKK